MNFEPLVPSRELCEKMNSEMRLEDRIELKRLLNAYGVLDVLIAIVDVERDGNL